MRVLVTGGSGFIGRHVVRLLQERGDVVSVVDLNPHPDPAVDCLIGDIRDADVVQRAANDSIDAIIHLAAITSVLQSVNDPVGVYATNVAATQLLLDRCRVAGIGHFVLASTNAVVGNVGTTVINEDTTLHPLTPYGATKAAGEMLCSAYSASYDIATVALRFTNVYGAGMQMKDSVIARLMKAAMNGGGIDIYGDGEQLRDYVYVTDAADSLLMGLGFEGSSVLCIGAAESVSLNTLHALTCDVTGVAVAKTYVEAKAGEMPAVVVSTERAIAAGYKPSHDVRSGLAATWEDFKARA